MVPRQNTHILHDNREVAYGQQIIRNALDHDQDLAGRGDRCGGVGRAAVGGGQAGKLQAALDTNEIGAVHEIGQQVCGSEGRLGVI